MAILDVAQTQSINEEDDYEQNGPSQEEQEESLKAQ
jgi:hypothetical protein